MVDEVEAYEQYLHDAYIIGVISQIQPGSQVLSMKTCSVREQLENVTHCRLTTGTPVDAVVYLSNEMPALQLVVDVDIRYIVFARITSPTLHLILPLQTWKPFVEAHFHSPQMRPDT